MIGRCLTRNHSQRKGRFALVCSFVLAAVFLTVVAAKAATINSEYVERLPELVPAASAADNETIWGVDANQNGVRDDVERWIAATFPSDFVGRAVALQLGAAMQSVLAAGGDADYAVYSAARKLVESALECLLASTGDDVQSVIFGQMLGVVLNTPGRAAVVARLEERFPPNGIGFESPSTDKCLFTKTKGN